MKSDDGTRATPGDFANRTHRQTLEAEFLLRFASKLQPGEVLEAHYNPESPLTGGPGFMVGFAGMFCTQFVGASDQTRVDDILGSLRAIRGQMATFARKLASDDRKHDRGVIAVDFVAGCIAALLFEEGQKRASATVRAAGLDRMAQEGQDAGVYPELGKGDLWGVFAKPAIPIGRLSDTAWHDTLIRASTYDLAKALWEQQPKERRDGWEIDIRKVDNHTIVGGSAR